MTINTDAKYNGLGRFGYSGAQEDRELKFYKANGATSDNVRDAEVQFLTLRGFTEGSVDDRWNAYLKSLGYTGANDDMLPRWWGEMPGSSAYLDFLKSSPFTSVSGLDPRITFSRASNATVTGPDGTLQYAPHNLLTFSEQFDNAAWTSGGSGIIDANVATAPDGTSTADRLTTTGGTGSRFQSANVSAGLTYTFSVYVKLGTMSVASYRLAIYNNTAAGWIAQDIVPDQTPTSTEWTRITYTFAAPAGCSSIRVYPFRNGNSITSSTVLFWGAQLNVGALQPYYPTTVKNLLGFTQEFDNAYWTKSNSSVTANATTAPDGSVTADKLVENTANAQHSVATIGATVGVSYGISFYAKAAERSQVAVSGFGLFAQGFVPLFDLSIGTVTSAPANSSITSVGNGWYRCFVPVVASGTAALTFIVVSAGQQSYLGDGTSGIFIWGAQLSDSASLDQYVYNPGAAPTAAAYYGPRFDYDPVTLAPKGLLIEEQRTNLLLQSGFAGAVAGTPGTAPTSWSLSPSGGAIDSVVTDLLGQNTVTLSATANRQALNQTITLAANTTYTLSTVVVANSGVAVNQLLAAVNPPAGATQSYTINGVTVVNPNVTAPIAGDRVAIVLVVAATAGTVIVRLGVGVNGNVTGTVALKWPQVEAGAFATSYIPTTTAAATRAADAAVMTGANFSNWYNQSEGTVYVEADMYETQSGFFRYPLIFNDASGSVANLVGFFVPSNSSNLRFAVNSAGVVSAGLQQSLTAGAGFKAAGAYKIDDFAASFNSETALTDVSGNAPSGVNTLVFGTTFHTVGVLSASSTHYKRIAYFPRRLSNAELQAITS